MAVVDVHFFLTADCPECGKPVLLKRGRRGEFLGCSGYPECKLTCEYSPVVDLLGQQVADLEAQLEQNPARRRKYSPGVHKYLKAVQEENNGKQGGPSQG